MHKAIGFAVVLALDLTTMAGARAQPITAEGLAQIQAYAEDKERRTPAERKIQSTLLHAARLVATGSMGPGLPSRNVQIEGFIQKSVAADSTVAVTIAGTVSADLVDAITGMGAK